MKVAEVQKNLPVKTRRGLKSWLILVLSGLTVGLLLAKITFSLNIIWQIFNFAFQVDESEGMIVAETLLIDKGVNIYALLTPKRFVAAPYTPLYYLLNWPFLHFSGASFKPGRLLSFVALCAIAFLLYKLVSLYSIYTKLPKKSQPDRVAGIAASLFWGSLGLAAFWGGAVKPDMLALCFSLAGIYAIYRYFALASYSNILQTASFQLQPGSKIQVHFQRDSWFYAAIVFFALAAMTKQTAFAGPIACMVFLVVNLRLTLALRFVTGWLGLTFGPMLIMNWLSGGGFWYHIVTVHELPWSLENYWKFFSAFVQSYQLYFGLALIFSAGWLFDIIKKALLPRSFLEVLRADKASLFVIYFGVSLGASLSAGTYGGNHNHLLELAAAMCLCAGAALARIRERWGWGRAGQQWIYPVVLSLICLQTLGLFAGEGRVKPENFPVLGNIAPVQSGLELLRTATYNPQWLGLEYRVPPEGLRQGLAQVAAFMTNDVGPLIYTDNVSLGLASSKLLLTTDPFTQTHATYLKRWDESYLIKLVETRQFHLIVLRDSIAERLQQTGEARDIYLSPGLAQAILANYKLTQRNAAFIYEPK